MVRTSLKPVGHNRPESVIEEALRSPLPSGPAPKKPPRTSSLLRNEVDESSVKNKNPLVMSRSKTEPCLRRGPKKLVPIRRTNSFHSMTLERARIMSRNGTFTKVELRHFDDSPSGEVGLLSFFSLCDFGK